MEITEEKLKQVATHMQLLTNSRNELKGKMRREYDQSLRKSATYTRYENEANELFRQIMEIEKVLHLLGIDWEQYVEE